MATGGLSDLRARDYQWILPVKMKLYLFLPGTPSAGYLQPDVSALCFAAYSWRDNSYACNFLIEETFRLPNRRTVPM